jgi:pectate lyase
MRRPTTPTTVIGALTLATALTASGSVALASVADPGPRIATTPASPFAAPIGFGANTTGGTGGETVTVTNADQLISEMQSDGRKVVRVSGVIQIDGMQDVASDKTVVGADAGAGISGGGLDVDEVNNVIIQGLNFSSWGDDAINVQEGATNVFIDHNSFTRGSDGAVDIKRASDFVTVSWNHFFSHDKTMLLGHDDGNGAQDRGHLRVTYHHNWFDGTGQRHPRVRFGNPVHVFNNYYSDIGDYGVASTIEGGVLVEANYFENVEDPFHLGEGDSPPGALQARDNHFVNSGAGQTGGSVAGIPYGYTPDPAANVKSIVQGGAGPGGSR